MIGVFVVRFPNGVAGTRFNGNATTSIAPQLSEITRMLISKKCAEKRNRVVVRASACSDCAIFAE